MSFGYVIAQLNVTNPEDYKEYVTKVTPIVEKFGGEQLGRRRRDDYTDGEPRIPVPQQTP